MLQTPCPAVTPPHRESERRSRFPFHRLIGLFSTIILFLSLALAAPSPQASYGGQTVEANELKAVYLYNFLQFVQWPEARPSTSAEEPLVICTLGDTRLNQSLESLQTTLSKSGKRPVRIVHYGSYRDGLDLGSCHLLFVGESERKHFEAIVAGLRHTPVLTVADSESFLDSGGMISLVESQGKLRWMINRPSAEKAGLRLNAQILRLAIKVLE